MSVLLGVFAIIDGSSTKPGNLVDLLFARSRHAFVAESREGFRSDLSRPRREDTTLFNFAANRWGLRVASGKTSGYARGLSVPLERLFTPPFSSRAPKPDVSPFTSRERCLRRGGNLTSVGAILDSGHIDRSRCHWAYLRRRVIARFDPSDLEASLPDLARSVGAGFDPKERRITFDPSGFREHVRRSIPESYLASPRRDELEFGLVRIAISNATDPQLQDLFATPKESGLYAIGSLSSNERDAIERYRNAALAIITGTGGGQTDYLRSLADLTKLPNISVSPMGTARLRFVGRDGKTGVEI